MSLRDMCVAFRLFSSNKDHIKTEGDPTVVRYSDSLMLGQGCWGKLAVFDSTRASAIVCPKKFRESQPYVRNVSAVDLVLP